MICDACGGTKSSSGVMLYHYEGGGVERDILAQFISQKSGRNWTGNDFELCSECNKEYKKVLSQNLREKILSELASKNSIDCPLLLKYGHRANFVEDSDWKEIQNALVKSIRRYKNEWQIKEMNYNQDRKEYFHPESGRQVSKLTVLVHQSAPVEFSSNGFIIIRRPKMYLKNYFTSEQWNQIEKNFNEHSTQSPRFPLKLFLGIILLVLLVSGIILGWLYQKKQKKPSKN